MNIKVKTALRAILIGATVIPLVIIGLVASINIFGFSSDMLRSETITVGAAQSAGVQNIVSAYLEDVKSMGKLDFVAGAVTDLNSNKEDVRALKTICDERSGGKILEFGGLFVER